MNIIEHMMKHYDKALGELMDAQEYLRCAEHAEKPSTKALYKTLAKQELEHEAMIRKDGDELFSSTDATDSLHMVWHHLKKHLSEWRVDIERHLAEV